MHVCSKEQITWSLSLTHFCFIFCFPPSPLSLSLFVSLCNPPSLSLFLAPWLSVFFQATMLSSAASSRDLAREREAVMCQIKEGECTPCPESFLDIAIWSSFPLSQIPRTWCNRIMDLVWPLKPKRMCIIKNKKNKKHKIYFSCINFKHFGGWFVVQTCSWTSDTQPGVRVL